MPVVTINDLKAKSSNKRGRKMGITTVNDGEYLQLGKGSECVGNKTRKAEKQDKDEDFRGEHEENTNKGLKEARTQGGMKQKQGSGEEADESGNVYMELTPRQMAALHWANRGRFGRERDCGWDGAERGNKWKPCRRSK